MALFRKREPIYLYGDEIEAGNRRIAAQLDAQLGRKPTWLDSSPGIIDMDAFMINKRFGLMMSYSPENIATFVDIILHEYEEGNVTFEEIHNVLSKYKSFEGRDKLLEVYNLQVNAERLKRKIQEEKASAERLAKTKDRQLLNEAREKWLEDVIIPLERASVNLSDDIARSLLELQDKIILPTPRTWRDDVKDIGNKAWKTISE